MRAWWQLSQSPDHFDLDLNPEQVTNLAPGAETILDLTITGTEASTRPRSSTTAEIPVVAAKTKGSRVSAARIRAGRPVPGIDLQVRKEPGVAQRHEVDDLYLAQNAPQYRGASVFQFYLKIECFCKSAAEVFFLDLFAFTEKGKDKLEDDSL